MLLVGQRSFTVWLISPPGLACSWQHVTVFFGVFMWTKTFLIAVFVWTGFYFKNEGGKPLFSKISVYVWTRPENKLCGFTVVHLTQQFHFCSLTPMSWKDCWTEVIAWLHPLRMKVRLPHCRVEQWKTDGRLKQFLYKAELAFIL